jgi:hypothetical protein
MVAFWACYAAATPTRGSAVLGPKQGSSTAAATRQKIEFQSNSATTRVVERSTLRQDRGRKQQADVSGPRVLQARCETNKACVGHWG